MSFLSSASTMEVIDTFEILSLVATSKEKFIFFVFYIHSSNRKSASKWDVQNLRLKQQFGEKEREREAREFIRISFQFFFFIGKVAWPFPKRWRMRRTWVAHVVLLVSRIQGCERCEGWWSSLFASCRCSIHWRQWALRHKVKCSLSREALVRRNLVFAGLVGCGAITRPSRIYPYSPANYDFANNMPGTCMQACSAAGYAYASVSGGRLCFCGSSSANIALLNTTSTTLCQVNPCTGDATVYCGDTDYELVYTSIGVIDVSVFSALQFFDALPLN